MTGYWPGLSGMNAVNRYTQTVNRELASVAGGRTGRIHLSKISNPKMEYVADFHALFELKDDSALRVTFGLVILSLLKAFCKISQTVNPSHLGVGK